MSAPVVTVASVGNAREPIAIVDGFAPDADALRAFAATQSWVPAGRSYPGIKAPLPDSYLRTQGSLIGTILRDVFGVAGRIALIEARFSIVTTPPGSLAVAQCLPHFDALDAGQMALVHYLVPGGTEGTAFYRHRSTGFETVDATRGDAYLAALDRDLAAMGAPTTYMTGDTPLFACIGSVEGVYNRALLYRGGLLHSGTIAAGAALPADPSTGRLTVTGFFAS